MQKLSDEAIQKLLTIEDTPKVTLYIPLEATASPPHISENQIRFKNLIHKAVEELRAQGDPSQLGQQLCDLLDRTHNDIEFWKATGRSLLICAGDHVVEMFNLPVDTEEYVAVDDAFHLAPVLALMGDARKFYVLALAQQNPKLYIGDMYGLAEMEIGLPANMRVGLGIDEPNQKTENQGSSNGSSLNTGWFNGRGGARDPQDTDRIRFFHLIDKQLLAMTDRTLPLILAGIDAENAEYRELSKYPLLMKGMIPGNHTATRTDDLFGQALQIVMQELVQPDHDAAREEYERLQGANPDRTANDQKSILAAAEQGRIDKLLTSMSRQTTDTVQDKVESVLRISFPEPAFSKTLNSLAMQVWQMKGKVMSLLPHEMPGGAQMVARLRY